MKYWKMQNAEHYSFTVSKSMNICNCEFKVKVDNLEEDEQKLLMLSPTYNGYDHQINTYFQVPKGRLKLREGNF